MKWVFIVLLVVNLLYFGQEFDKQIMLNTTNSRVALHIPADAVKLTLIRELPEPPPPRGVQQQDVETAATGETDEVKEEETLATLNQDETNVQIEEEFVNELVTQLPDISIPDISGNTDATRTMCFSYGPFPDNNQLNELVDWFRERNVEVGQRLEAGDDNQLFWIYLAPLASRDGAIQAMEDLKKKGVKDYRLIETGDLKNAISLGLFSTQASVNRRLNELTDKGYKPVVIPRRDKKAVYWVDVRLAGQQDVLNQMFTEYPVRYNSIPVNCSEIALR